jgi:hypothetical protein
MRVISMICVSGLALLATAWPARAAPPSAEATAAIDRHLAAGWDKAKITPAAPADDAEFLRRIYLDLAGHVPGVTEARQFLDDKQPDKRQRLIENLLYGKFASGPNHAYANHFTNVWRALLLPETATNLQARFQMPSFQSWLWQHLDKNSGYDAVVRELLTAPLGQQGSGKAIVLGNNAEPSPTAFFFAKDLMPENLAAAASRVFLGVRLECAQCHDHPFATWKRDQFWNLAAFFSGVKRGGPGEFVVPGREDASAHEIAIPNTNRKAPARYLDGKEPTWQAGVGARETLAQWITRPDNPYFARATVNRLWAYFFGSGLVEPVDEMIGAENSSHFPELLDDLARAFVEAKFDLRFLIQAIVSSRAYQLSSRFAGDGANPDQLRLFARMPVRGLSPEQLFDSVAKATGHQEDGTNLPPGLVAVGPQNARAEFLAHFAATGDKPTEKQTSILQALSLMNGQMVADATSVDKSILLSGVLDAPFLNANGVIEVLYLAALSRRPTDKEAQRVSRFLTEQMHSASNDSEREKLRNQALADVFWTLLNSGEFLLNH